MNKDKVLAFVQNKLQNKKLLYLVVGGSHAWGLARPDSDLDLVGIYQEPTTKVLQMRNVRGNISGSDTIEHKNEYDLQLYEVEKFFKLLCNNNGNMVNLLHLPNPIYISDKLPWGELKIKFLTKKLKHYYKGYAASQRKRALSCRGGKALIYTYREMLLGICLMKYGKVVHDFTILLAIANDEGWYNGSLLEKYYEPVLNNEKINITDSEWTKFYMEWEELAKILDKEAQTSPLPDSFDGIDWCNNLLINLRLADLNGQNNTL